MVGRRIQLTNFIEDEGINEYSRLAAVQNFICTFSEYSLQHVYRQWNSLSHKTKKTRTKITTF